jgi:TonB family protein
MRMRTVTVIGVLAFTALAGCEKRTRTKNSSGSALFEEGTATTTNVYRFVGVEQTLTDARNAAKAENWPEVIAATDALLKQQPGNTEARALSAQAKVELPMLAKYNEFMKAATANEVAAAMRHHRAIAETSMYRERAKPEFEKLKVVYVESQIGDTRALNRAGRCDDARRVARVTGDWFPEARDRLEEAASGCRPAKGSTSIAAATTGAEAAAAAAKAEEGEKSQPIAMAAPSAPQAPIGVSAEAPQKAVTDATREPLVSAKPAGFGDGKTLASAMPAAAPASVTPIPSAAPPPPPVAPKIVPASDLEALRLSGDREPSLPAGAKMIMNRDNVKKISIAVKVCVSDQGVPSSVKLVKSSDYGDANEKVLSDIRKWRFRPYMNNGVAVPVCTATLLTYQLQ